MHNSCWIVASELLLLGLFINFCIMSKVLFVSMMEAGLKTCLRISLVGLLVPLLLELLFRCSDFLWSVVDSDKITLKAFYTVNIYRNVFTFSPSAHKASLFYIGQTQTVHELTSRLSRNVSDLKSGNLFSNKV